MNHRSINIRRIFFILSLLIFYFLSSTSAHAWQYGEALVPCGGASGGICDFSSGSGECIGGSNAGNFCSTSDECGSTTQLACTKCDLFKLFKNVVDFIMIAAAPILATLFILIAGVYLMLGGTNPGMLAQGKRIFKDTMIGILIVMLAWLITNTLIRSLADPTAIGGNWFEYTCLPS